MTQKGQCALKFSLYLHLSSMAYKEINDTVYFTKSMDGANVVSLDVMSFLQDAVLYKPELPTHGSFRTENTLRSGIKVAILNTRSVD